jgi:hypothetical protein
MFNLSFQYRQLSGKEAAVSIYFITEVTLFSTPFFRYISSGQSRWLYPAGVWRQWIPLT